MRKSVKIISGIVGLGVVMFGTVSITHVFAAKTTPQAPRNYKIRLLKQQEHPHQPTAPPLKGPITPVPPPIEGPRLVNNDMLPNGGSLNQVFNFTPSDTNPTGYALGNSRNVVAGNMVANPNTGVIIVEHVTISPLNVPTPSVKVYKIPGEGALNIVGFFNKIIDIKSAAGTGTFNLSTQQITWNAGQ